MGTYQTALGAIDGVNTTYITPTPYVPGYSRFILNGQLLAADCIDEVDANTGEVRWLDAQPPREGDTLLIYYVDQADQVALEDLEVVICPLQGVLQGEQALGGALDTQSDLHGTLAPAQALGGALDIDGLLTGSLEEITLVGRLERCD